MRPDHGAYLHAQRISATVSLVFYDVPIDHVSVTDTSTVTTLVNKVEKGTEYAISFDFTEEAVAQLLARAPGGTLGTLERAARGPTPRARTVEFTPPLRVQLEARVIPLQRVRGEFFAPLLVYRVA